MTIVDMHAHIAHHSLFPEDFLVGMKRVLRERAMNELGRELQESLLDRIARRQLADPDCTNLLEQMDAAGIEKAVLLIADLGFDHEDSAALLEAMYQHYHRVQTSHPNRFVVFGGSDPRRGGWALHLFERGVRDLGFGGLKLYPPCGYEIDDSGLSPYYELCERYGVPVLLHTGPSLSNMPGDRDYPASILRAAGRFPRVRFVLGHAAFQNFETNLGVAAARRNVYLEASGFQRVFEQKDQVAFQLRCLFDRVPEQVVFGTDWPVFNIKNSQKDWVDYFVGLDVLSKDDEARFFHRNAEAVLRS